MKHTIDEVKTNRKHSNYKERDGYKEPRIICRWRKKDSPGELALICVAYFVDERTNISALVNTGKKQFLRAGITAETCTGVIKRCVPSFFSYYEKETGQKFRPQLIMHRVYNWFWEVVDKKATFKISGEWPFNWAGERGDLLQRAHELYKAKS